MKFELLVYELLHLSYGIELANFATILVQISDIEYFALLLIGGISGHVNFQIQSLGTACTGQIQVLASKESLQFGPIQSAINLNFDFLCRKEKVVYSCITLIKKRTETISIEAYWLF